MCLRSFLEHRVLTQIIFEPSPLLYSIHLEYKTTWLSLEIIAISYIIINKNNVSSNDIRIA